MESIQCRITLAVFMIWNIYWHYLFVLYSTMQVLMVYQQMSIERKYIFPDNTEVMSFRCLKSFKVLLQGYYIHHSFGTNVLTCLSSRSYLWHEMTFKVTVKNSSYRRDLEDQDKNGTLHFKFEAIPDGRGRNPSHKLQSLPVCKCS